MTLTVGSLFSGIGGFDLGLERAGFKIAFQVEIDPFCQRVLAKHWPEVPRYGDVRNIGLGRGPDNERGEQDNATAGAAAAQWDCSRVDLICGGFPCQDLSVAGKRAGLAGDRSGLWFEFHRILSELRPTFCLIENVPGLLSSNQGRDFGVVLAGLGELWPAVGWAVLDSQFFGVPQRRRRVYVIGGPTRASVQQILSLCEGGDWHPQKGREAGEDVAATVAGGAYGAGERDGNPNLFLAKSLRARANDSHREDSSTYIPDVAFSVLAREHKGVSQREDVTTLIAHTLSADGFDASEDGTGRGTPLVFESRYARNGRGAPSEIVPPLKAESGQTGKGDSAPLVAGASVRRLTPVECERLQGFPDGWTQLDDRTPDGPKYRALGNAVSVPVVEYIGRRIVEVLS